MTSAHDREAERLDAGPGEAAAAGLYTETLARLYWHQGYGAKALAIYRHLLGLQPDNAELRAKVATLERQLAAGETGGDEPQQTALAAGSGSHQSPRYRTARVIAHLERWLAQLRRQRQPVTPQQACRDA